MSPNGSKTIEFVLDHDDNLNPFSQEERVRQFCAGTTKELRSQNLGVLWSCQPDLNWRPHPYQGFEGLRPSAERSTASLPLLFFLIPKADSFSLKKLTTSFCAITLSHLLSTKQGVLIKLNIFPHLFLVCIIFNHLSIIRHQEQAKINHK